MLKTHTESQIWLIQQHHHAQVSGYLAAHWGGANGFAKLGHYPGAADPVRWRDEVVLAIAEHDNGWWEWEAMPQFSAEDGLPVGLGERAPAVTTELDQWRTGGFDRWRAGIDRLAGPHPYAALLVSLHAYWLYAVEFPELTDEHDEVRRHFIFGGKEKARSLVGNRKKTRAFLEEQRVIQAELIARLAENPAMAGATESSHLDPHFRLLQLLDSLSLFLALNDSTGHFLPEVPRASWDDRVDLQWRKTGERTIALDPYPFAIDPLPVHLPARVLTSSLAGTAKSGPLALLHGTPMSTVEFLLTGG